MSAFGPYGGIEQIDFSKLYGRNLFLITGDTGSGKTTIFDAICFALYGTTSGMKKEAKTLKSSFADSNSLCFVELEFEQNGKKYLIERVPEQLVAKARGGGFKQQNHLARLTMPDGTIKTNLKEIAGLIEQELVGFDRASFNKVAMLAQGQFQKLLSERGEQQLKSFRKIFETEIFEEIVNGLFDFKQKILKNFEVSEQQNLKTLELVDCDDFEFLSLKQKAENNWSQIVDWLSRKNSDDLINLKNLEVVQKQIEKRIQQLQVKLELLGLHERKKLDFEQNEKRLKILRQKSPNSDEVERSEIILKKVDGLKFLKNAVDELKTEFCCKKSEFVGLQRGLKVEQKKLEDAKKNCGQIEKIESDLISLQSEIEKLNLFEQSFELISGFDVELNGLNERLSKIDFNLKDVQLKKLFVSLKAEIDLEVKILAKIKKLVELNDEKIKLESDFKKFSETHLKLSKLFLNHQAAMLAENLEEGQPCPVCGCLVHTKKNRHFSGNIVTQFEVEKSQNKVFELHERCEKVKSEIVVVLAELKANFDLNFDIENLNELKTEIEDRNKKILQLKHDFKQKLPSSFFKQNFSNADFDDFDFDSEIANLKIEQEKNMARVELLCSKKSSIIEKIPDSLRDGKLILQTKIFKQNQKFELTCKKEAILQCKIDAEKNVEVFKAKVAALKSSLVEIADKKKVFEQKLNEKLRLCGFDFNQFLNYLKNFEKIKLFIESSKKIFKEIELLELRQQSLQQDLERVKGFDLQKLNQLKHRKILQKNLIKQLISKLANRLAINKNCQKVLAKLNCELKVLNERFGAAKMLSEVAKGTRKRIGFEQYVLVGFINEVLVFASNYFKKATSGRYVFEKLRFQNLESLNFSVFDVYSGKIRDVSTLSGGETFVASLSLCLGLRDVVAGKFGRLGKLSTMLIDEGFGTLDSNHLNNVADCLQLLGGQGSLIGIISHVEELKFRVAAQIQVKSKPGGRGSRIKIVLN